MRENDASMLVYNVKGLRRPMRELSLRLGYEHDITPFTREQAILHECWLSLYRLRLGLQLLEDYGAFPKS